MSAENENKVTLNYPGGSAEFPIINSTDGDSVIDFSKLNASTGLNSYDIGFVNTASTKSAITYIDGDEGILRYRGYPIEQLAGQKSFVETAYLLIYGELPNAKQLSDWDERLRRHTLIHEDLKNIFHSMPQNAHPMSVLAAGVSALSTFYQDSLNPHDEYQVELSTVRLLSKLPTLVAYSHKNSMGQALLYPDNSLSYVENFLRMSFGNMAEPYIQNPVVVKALDTLLVLHADHEQNCSTSTVRLVGSSQANLFASVSAGVSALFGPLHGGANEAVLEMLADIRDSGDSVQKYIDRVKNKEDGVKLMGFGHRVYKNMDPRARIVKATADKVLADLGVSDPLLDIAKELEAAALADEYFISRKLYPNVDFYTGVIYKAMGFPTRMFTALFAMGRLPGWISHWREMNHDPATKIGRPQQLYIGSQQRDI
ncbi:MAG: citrate synthase [Micrococcales bacterium]|nr:citrate synthase [Microbacteriaceae bacterium]NBR22677.1 citrate synthase [Micrococcales bacterium]NBX95000.1 citrate synthase [Actinomycetota bacterium]NBS60668.1 citrate synthase [Microbacteriaceae bacterium]NDC19052.1 citrate synthase [Microbacteriaceae bacterium]